MHTTSQITIPKHALMDDELLIIVEYLSFSTGVVCMPICQSLQMTHYFPAKRKASSESPYFNCSLEIAIKRIRITSTPGEIR
jgi:hypothetical protein